MSRSRDRKLGMHHPVSRRDFLQGVPLALGAAATSLANPLWATSKPPYPPALTGMRGSAPGTFEVAHALALGGREWSQASALGESYDLVVAGGGVSGLASALFYRQQAGSSARILILDNHDDFGGHARRNEFNHQGRQYVALGGGYNLEYDGYSRVSRDLLEGIGVDPRQLEDRGVGVGAVSENNYGVYFDRETFGRDVLVRGAFPDSRRSLARAVQQFPLAESHRQALTAFLENDRDLLAHMSQPDKIAYLRSHSYEHFLRSHAGLHPEAIRPFNKLTHGIWGAGADVLPCTECFLYGAPGIHAVGELPELPEFDINEKNLMYIDGNASVPRLMVRSLIPGAVPTDLPIEQAPTRYEKLDIAGNPVRLRLNATVVQVSNTGQGVSVNYVRGGKAESVQARHCVVACQHSMIPYLVPELDEGQRQALADGLRTPMLVSNVLLRESRALNELDLEEAYSPGRLHALTWRIRQPGQAQADEDPMVLQFMGSPLEGGSADDRKTQCRLGRLRLMQMTFADFERELRSHLDGMLGPAGFDAARDVLAITVNRWPHGYCWEYTTMDPQPWSQGSYPHEIARRPAGRISIAGADSGAHSYIDGAVDQAFRAVQELTAKTG